MTAQAHADALLRHADELQRRDQRPQAIAAYQQALALRPQAATGWYNLGYLLNAEGRHAEALAAYGQALAHGVAQPEEVHLNRAVILTDRLRREDDAQRELEAALAIAPAYVPALLNMGNLHEERGDKAQALEYYGRILAKPGSAAGADRDHHYEALARSVNLRPPKAADDPMLQALVEAAAPGTPQHNPVRASLLFALGGAFDKLGRFDEAFAAYDDGNRYLRLQTGPTYDRARTERMFDSLIAATPAADPPAAAATPPAPGAEPLFICGMFRSGSTLLEQVLGSSPLVTPGGELDFLMKVAMGPMAPYPATLAVRAPEKYARIAQAYRDHQAQLFPEGVHGRYITDKRPDNFLLVGLIKRLFPGARIIHTTRHPLDNGLSIYMQILNHHVIGYANDLSNIGHYYGQYRRLMAHWKQVFPESVFDFDYDAFVREPMPQLERLFAFLGLDLDERVLEFHQLGNTVKTASYLQVRNPLYGSASGRWRRYAAHLDPLRQALRAGGVPLPDDDAAPG
jgi:tetratricopeptide (TPR) repeat protein